MRELFFFIYFQKKKLNKRNKWTEIKQGEAQAEQVKGKVKVTIAKRKYFLKNTYI